ncbi:hypothetical protein Nstercoris_00454 [Nitrosomonas stercoris]|uniref:Uncharacterized protein n=1 Tax=Nitrosomonas stercoris TaxID=1444684 RepID=A0A4Y1YMT4_9PROT|nr:hypothetical protein Nstercoris_00454 [Nitrosomonas stercoris]
MKQLALYFQANRLEKKAQWQQAAAIYKKIASVAKDNSGRLAYRQGMMAEKLKDWPNAQQFFSQAIAKRPHDANCFYHLGLAYEYDKKYQQAAKALEKSLAIKPNNPYALRHLGKVLIYGGDPAEGEGKLYQAIALRPDIDIFWQDLITAIRRQGRTWQEVEILQKRIEQQGKNVQLYFELGEAQDKMNRFAEAAQAFAQANVIRPGDAMWHFREGYAWERAGKAEKAQIAYTAAIAADKKLNAKVFGIGVFHQQRGYWPQAAEAYTKAAAADPTNAELQYRLGLAHDRCYRWEQATQCYRRALALDTTQANWHYRLGFVLERQELLEQAAQAYEYAATIHDRHTPYWFYRLGYVLAQAGKYEQACSAFLNTRTQASLDALPMLHAQTALSLDYQEKLKASVQAVNPQAQSAALHSDDQAAAFYKLGNQAEQLQMWEEAAQAYRSAVARSNNHNGLWYYRLGYVLMHMGRMEQAVKAFLNTQEYRKSDSIKNTKKLVKTPTTRQYTLYAEYLNNNVLDPKIIFYESFGGIWLACNPLRIFEELINDQSYKDYTHVLTIQDETLIDKKWKRENVIFVKRNSDLYIFYLVVAKWIIHNSSLPSFFIKGRGQKYLNTWHGTPLKFLGKDIKESFMEHRWSTRNRLQATHLIHPNNFTEDILLKHCDIEKISTARSKVTGYPRNDKVINPNPNKYLEIKNKLRIFDSKPIVLYAPTWRGKLGNFHLNSKNIVDDISAMQGSGWHLIFRGHYFSENLIKASDATVDIVHASIDTSDLLGLVDVLITDYSSIFFDYLSRMKPIIYYAYDLENYEKSRGMYFSLRKMPGVICKNRLELLPLIKKVTSSKYIPDKKHIECVKEFCSHDDGSATKRVIDFFFNEDRVEINQLSNRGNGIKKNILVYAGDFDDEIIHENLKNWIEEQDLDKCNIYILLEPNNINSKLKKERFEEIQTYNVFFLNRAGRRYANLEQEYLRTRRDLKSFDSLEVNDILKNQYQLEYKRLFGSSEFSEMIMLSDRNEFWNKVKKYNFD